MKTITKLSAGLFTLLLVFGVARNTEAANVVETAQGVDDLSTLVDLVVAADLANTLATAEDITVFAPTNDAFEKIPNVVMMAIDKDPNILTSILTYHVSPNRLGATDVIGSEEIPTLEGSNIKVMVAGKNVILDNGSKITATDIETDNATVHLINKVLIPWDNIILDVINAVRHK